MSDRVLALAGVFQASALVHSIATTGVADRQAFETSIASLYALDADSVIDVYGGSVSDLRLGLETLGRELSGRISNPQIIRYAFTLLHIERRLSRNRMMVATLREGVAAASRQAAQLGRVHENVISRFEELYVNTVSTLKPRVVVHGKPLFLQQPHYVAEIRALLLAGVRSAVLWSQLGGRRWHLLFTRKAVAGEAQRLAA